MADTTAAEQPAAGEQPVAEQATQGADSARSDENATPATDDAAAAAVDDESTEDKPKRGRPRKQSSARKTRTVELTLTVTGTIDGGDWQVEVVQGTKRVVPSIGVSATAVSAAAKDLHPDVSEVIEEILESARQQHRSRVEELEAELNAAKEALAGLQD